MVDISDNSVDVLSVSRVIRTCPLLAFYGARETFRVSGDHRVQRVGVWPLAVPLLDRGVFAFGSIREIGVFANSGFRTVSKWSQSITRNTCYTCEHDREADQNDNAQSYACGDRDP